MEYNPDDDNQSEYAGDHSVFGASHTSFKTIMSGATAMTSNQQHINKMIKANIDNEEDLDEYVEQILDMQRKKAKREE